MLGFIRSPPMLAVYDVHSLPLGGAGRDFPFTEDEYSDINVYDTVRQSKKKLFKNFQDTCIMKLDHFIQFSRKLSTSLCTCQMCIQPPCIILFCTA
jgi:hypothetical protein